MATETDKVNTGALATLVAVGTFATIAVILGVDALVRYETAQLAAERAVHAGDVYRSVAAEQKGKLASAKVPITQAMEEVAAELARDPASASPLPPASAAPAPATGEVGAAPADAPPAAPTTSAAPAPAPTTAAVAPQKAPAAAGASATSPNASTVLAVPPAAPTPKPAPAAPAPSDG
jgi:hypothetical protein